MVSTQTTKLNRECSFWREQLRSYRTEMGQLRDQLQQMAGGENDNDVLAEVEHYHNQFYIQQINIHDLKQAIKQHDRRLQLEEVEAAGNVSAETKQEHELLNNRYKELEDTLGQLRTAFTQFMAKA